MNIPNEWKLIKDFADRKTYTKNDSDYLIVWDDGDWDYFSDWSLGSKSKSDKSGDEGDLEQFLLGKKESMNKAQRLLELLTDDKIADIVKSIVSEFVTDDPKKVKYINSKDPEHYFSFDCVDFVMEFKKRVPGAKTKIGHDHTYAEYNGKYYDAETPYGVSDPSELPFYKRAKVGI